MKRVICLMVVLMNVTMTFSQTMVGQGRVEKPCRISHVLLGFEIGSNYLDINQLNQELTQLGLPALDPYTNNFTFQIGVGVGKVEFYNNLTFLAASDSLILDGANGRFVSSFLNGTYIGFGARSTLASFFNNRLSVAASIDLSTAYYSLRLSKATISNRNVGSLLDSSQMVLARSYNRTLQPAIELLYAIGLKQNRFDIGLKIGYIYHLREEGWENQYGISILGLSPIGNNESYNVSLRLLYTIPRCGRRMDDVPKALLNTRTL